MLKRNDGAREKPGLFHEAVLEVRERGVIHEIDPGQGGQVSRTAFGWCF